MDAILTFHSIDTSGSVLSYAPDDLRRLVADLLESGVRIVPLEELLAPAADGAPRVALTFDDGMASVHAEALPILREAGATATLYVVTERVGRDNRWESQPEDAPRFELMGWEELRELASEGFGIGSHTASHPRLVGLDEERWRVELEDSRARLEDELGRPARHFAYPYGVRDAEAERRVAALYDTAVTTDMRFVSRSDRPERLPRLDTYYLRGPERFAPLFGARTRGYLAARAFLRNVRGLVAPS